MKDVEEPESSNLPDRRSADVEQQSSGTLGRSEKQKRPQRQQQISRKAIVSFILSIISMLFLIYELNGLIFGPIAICLALSAKQDIAKSEKEDEEGNNDDDDNNNIVLGGKCLAGTGLILGIIGFITSLLIAFGVISEARGHW